MDLLCWVALAARALASIGASLQLPAAEVRGCPQARRIALPDMRKHPDMSPGLYTLGQPQKRVCPGSYSPCGYAACRWRF